MKMLSQVHICLPVDCLQEGVADPSRKLGNIPVMEYFACFYNICCNKLPLPGILWYAFDSHIVRPLEKRDNHRPASQWIGPSKIPAVGERLFELVYVVGWRIVFSHTSKNRTFVRIVSVLAFCTSGCERTHQWERVTFTISSMWRVMDHQQEH